MTVTTPAIDSKDLPPTPTDSAESSETEQQPNPVLRKSKSSKKTYITASSPPSTEITPAATRSPSTSSIPQSPVSLPEEQSNEDEEDDGISIPLPPTSTIPTKVLDIDANTDDSHVARDPRMIRLTGAHPYNVEPPLTTLFDQGKSIPLPNPP